MSLDYNLSKIKDWKEVCWMMDSEDKTKSTMNPITDGLIWYTIAVGIGEITEKNVEEFYKRMVIHDKVSGPILLHKGEPRFITFAEVKAHIGLHTNVWPKETNARFFKKLMSTVKIPKEDK